MDFDTNASNIILFIFQTKINFQRTSFFQHNVICLNEKLHDPNVFCEIT